MKNYIFLLFVVSILLLGCINLGGPSGSIDSRKLIPEKADVFAQVQVTKILQDEDFKKSIKESSGKDIEGELQNITDQTGFDPRTLQSMVLFFQLSETPKAETYMGIILKGSFNKDIVLGKFREKQKEKFKEETYEGVTIFTSVDSFERTTSIAFLDQGTAVFGSKDATKDVIDVFKGKKKAFDDANVNTVVSKVNSNSMFLLAMRVPQSYREQGSGPESELTSKTNAVGLSLDKSGQNVDLQAALNFVDTASASKAKDTIDGFLKLAKGYAKSGSVTEKLLGKVMLNSENTILTIKLTTTTDELNQVSKELKELAPKPINDRKNRPVPPEEYQYPYPEEYNYSEPYPQYKNETVFPPIPQTSNSS